MQELAHRSLQAGATVVYVVPRLQCIPYNILQLPAVSREYKASIFQPAVWDSMSQVCKVIVYIFFCLFAWLFSGLP
jgi:hypothetical protein